MEPSDGIIKYGGIPLKKGQYAKDCLLYTSLGYRAIRFCLQRTDIYNTQLRALVRASAFGRIKIMVPLVTCVDELRSVKAMVADIMKELDAEGIAYNKNLEIGIMMETPAACMMADVLAKEAAFFSIGTNDLTGYTMDTDSYLQQLTAKIDLQGAQTLFDMGCGPGTVSLALADKLTTIYGCLLYTSRQSLYRRAARRCQHRIN